MGYGNRGWGGGLRHLPQVSVAQDSVLFQGRRGEDHTRRKDEWKAIDPDQSQRFDHSGRNQIWPEPFPTTSKSEKRLVNTALVSSFPRLECRVIPTCSVCSWRVARVSSAGKREARYSLRWATVVSSPSESMQGGLRSLPGRGASRLGGTVRGGGGRVATRVVDYGQRTT